jgi:hypothetical protein
VKSVKSERGAFVMGIVLAAIVVAVPRLARADDGSYGGFALMGMVQPFGAGNDMGRRCADLGAADCSGGVPLGGGFMGYAGWAKSKLGYEIMLGALGDLQRPSARFDGVPHQPHGNPLLSTPPREETFIILRAGGMIAPRLRYTTAGDGLRGSVAGGLGLAYRYMALEREVTGKDGVEDRPYFATGTAYVSPALSLDGALFVRATSTLHVSFGLGIVLETAGADARSVADSGRSLAGASKVYPIATPAYEMAHGLQLLFLPYVGLHFGR